VQSTCNKAWQSTVTSGQEGIVELTHDPFRRRAIALPRALSTVCAIGGQGRGRTAGLPLFRLATTPSDQAKCTAARLDGAAGYPLLTLKCQGSSVQHNCAATEAQPGNHDQPRTTTHPANSIATDRAAGSSHRGAKGRHAVCPSRARPEEGRRGLAVTHGQDRWPVSSHKACHDAP
jgi:hypothetical protein